MANAPSLSASRREVAAALQSAGGKFPLIGRTDDILGNLAQLTLAHAINAYGYCGDAHRQTHLLLA